VTAPLVFSIRPIYVEAFRLGVKLYEYRTRRPRVAIGELVLIYETAPTSMIVAEATVEEMIEDTPGAVWDATWRHGGISREAFDAYFDSRESAVAFRPAMRWLPVHVSLPDGMRAPQSWARLHCSWPIGCVG